MALLQTAKDLIEELGGRLQEAKDKGTLDELDGEAIAEELGNIVHEMPDDVDHLFRTILSSWKEIHGLNGPYVPPIVTDPKELQDSCAPRKFDHGTPASRREGR